MSDKPTSTDPEIEQEAERILREMEICFEKRADTSHAASTRVFAPDLLDLLRELATLRRGAAKPFSDAKLREIEERAAKARQQYCYEFDVALDDIDTLLAALRSHQEKTI